MHSDISTQDRSISLKGVSASYGSTKVLDNLSIEVESGQNLALVGLSGSGKTTLLRLINGLVLPDAGEISVFGQSIPRDQLPEYRQKLGYVIQGGGLFPHLSIRENIGILGSALNMDKETIEKRIQEVAEVSQLRVHLLDRYPMELSGGQRQRVGLSRALFLNPPLILMDEPFGALDPITKKEVLGEFKDLFERLKKTIVLVTHDLNEAFYLCDQVCVLDKGRILQKGSKDELINSPKDPFVTQLIEAELSH